MGDKRHLTSISKDSNAQRTKSWDVTKLKGIIKPPPGVHVTIEEMNETIARGWAGKLKADQK